MNEKLKNANILSDKVQWAKLVGAGAIAGVSLTFLAGCDANTPEGQLSAELGPAVAADGFSLVDGLVETHYDGYMGSGQGHEVAELDLEVKPGYEVRGIEAKVTATDNVDSNGNDHYKITDVSDYTYTTYKDVHEVQVGGGLSGSHSEMVGTPVVHIFQNKDEMIKNGVDKGIIPLIHIDKSVSNKN